MGSPVVSFVPYFSFRGGAASRCICSMGAGYEAHVPKL